MLACRSIGGAVREGSDRNGATAVAAPTVWRNLLREIDVCGMAAAYRHPCHACNADSPIPALT
jgi:hypothetical protein